MNLALLKNILNKLSFLSKDQTLSLTNLTVIIFVTITAFRALFGGSILQISSFTWNIQTVNYPDALTVLVSLWNYDKKRQSLLSTEDNKQ